METGTCQQTPLGRVWNTPVGPATGWLAVDYGPAEPMDDGQALFLPATLLTVVIQVVSRWASESSWKVQHFAAPPYSSVIVGTGWRDLPPELVRPMVAGLVPYHAVWVSCGAAPYPSTVCI